MNALLSSLAAVALLPAMTGVPPGDAARTITVSLCNGGTMAIPVGGTVPAKGVAPCCAKGCRARRRQLIENKDDA